MDEEVLHGQQLLARLRGVLAVRPAADVALSGWVETQDFVLDLAHRRGYAGGEEALLTPIEWQVVEALVRHRGQLVSERRLLEEMSGSDADPGGLRRCMARIRGKLEPAPSPRPRDSRVTTFPAATAEDSLVFMDLL